MEKICNEVRSFIINELPPYLVTLTTEDVPLPSLTSDTVITGYIDIERNTQSSVCFIVPDIQTCSELTASEQEVNTQLDVWFFVRKAAPSVLYKQALRYGSAMKKAVLDYWTLSGTAAQALVTEIEYFSDVGASDRSIQAVRIRMTILTTES